VRPRFWECCISEGPRTPACRRSPCGLAHCGEARLGAEYPESYGLVRNIGGTKALTSKGGAVPAEGRGLGVLRIATARSRLMLTMGRAAHCAKCLRTLRFECPGGAGVWQGWGWMTERSEGSAGERDGVAFILRRCNAVAWRPDYFNRTAISSCRRSATRDSNN
jgi:hypothetical protein